MSYRAVLHNTGAITVGLFRPRTVEGPVALLLGRSPGTWYGEDESAHARTFVDAGYWVVTVDTPNWGNQTDMDNIDAALDWLATTWGRDTDRVVIVGHNRGCVAALNWAIRHDERVASVTLEAPIIDLAERYARVTADQASMNTAYGGSTGLELPGSNGSFASTPDHASLDITGDIDLRAEVAATDWTPSGSRSIVSKYTTNGQRSYRLRILNTGRLELVWTYDATQTQRNALSTASPTVVDGATLAVRATLDVNNGAGGRTTTFYTAPTMAGPWTQLGSAVTVTGAFPTGITSIFSGTAPLEVGSVANGIEPFQGTIYKVEVRNGIDGTVVANPDFSAQSTGTTSFNDSTGKTWTLNGSASITSSFSGAMPTWNPAHTHRKYIVKDWLGDRMTIWYSTSDTETPPAVTEALADAYAADLQTLSDTDPILVPPAPIVTNAAANDTGWTNQDGAIEQKLWTNYALDTVLTTDWAGGDGTITTDLGDGRILWSFFDTLIGTISTDWTYDSTSGYSSSMIIENSSGVLASQVYASGSSGPAWSSNPGQPGTWRWGQKGVIEGSFVRFLCIDVFFHGGGDPKKIYDFAEQHIVSRNLSDLAINGTTVSLGTDVLTDRILFGWSIVTQGGFTYIYGTRDYPGEYWAYVARTSVGNLTTDTWEFWNGSGWTTTRASAARMQTNLGADLYGTSISVEYLSASSKWILVTMTSSLVELGPPPDTSVTGLRIYTGAGPTGPWTLQQTLPVPLDGAVRYDGYSYCYQPQIHLHISPPGKIMVSYNASLYQVTVATTNQDFTVYRPHFVVVDEP